MKSIDFIRLMQHSKVAVFTTSYAASVIGKDTKYTSLFLSRLAESGEIKVIEKGKYYLPGTSAYAIASNIIRPSYISMLAAFKYHGITTQNISTIDVVSSKSHGYIESIEGYSVNFIKLMPKRIFGFYRDQETGAFVAEIEKAVVDSLHMEMVPLYYINEAVESAIAENKLDLEKLDAYAKMMGSKVLIKRIQKLKKLAGLESKERLKV